CRCTHIHLLLLPPLYRANVVKAQVRQRVLHRLALRIEHSLFGRNDNLCFHFQLSGGIPTPASWVTMATEARNFFADQGSRAISASVPAQGLRSCDDFVPDGSRRVEAGCCQPSPPQEPYL